MTVRDQASPDKTSFFCLDKHNSADDGNSEAEQHSRVIPNISGSTEEGRDLGSRRTIGAIAACRATVRASSVDARASSAGGASLVGATQGAGCGND